jgi:hypothetical protein
MEYSILEGGKVLEPHYMSIIYGEAHHSKDFGYVCWKGFNKRQRICQAGRLVHFYQVDFKNRRLEKLLYDFSPVFDVITGGVAGDLLLFCPKKS